jgi:hypothetical protein
MGENMNDFFTNAAISLAALIATSHLGDKALKRSPITEVSS